VDPHRGEAEERHPGHELVFDSMPRYSEEEARVAVADSQSYSEVLRRLGMRPAGGNHAVLRRYVDEVWRIPTDHFDPGAAASKGLGKKPRPLAEILVEGSTYSRAKLKWRLYESGLKQRICEICGQGEMWRGRQMSLILDHINGVPDDNRIENLRIVCPNCAATLETHCGRKNSAPPASRRCKRCGQEFAPKYRRHAYCSRDCGVRWDRSVLRGRPQPDQRRVERPPYERLLEELKETSYLAVGRKYGVPDNAVRKWVRFYERQMEREAAENGGRTSEG
jgi:transposase-like protein